MKKNKMMRLASGLLVAVLLTTSTISGTFAKYTTQDKASDAARVAKWGVELQVAGDLYGSKYKDAANSNIASADNTNITVYGTDSTDADENIVAPGTLNNSGFSFKLNGKPEVNGTITTKIEYENIYLTSGTYGVMVLVPTGVVTDQNFTELGTLYKYNNLTKQYTVATIGDKDEDLYTLEDDVTLGEDYYPVEYKMTGSANYNTAYDTALKTDTLAGLVGNLTTALGVAGPEAVEDGKTTNTWTVGFTANTDLASFAIDEQNIQWKWDFCQQSTCPTGDSACGYCKADTILGNLMAGDTETKVVKKQSEGVFAAPTPATGTEENDYNLETSFSIDITVTQVD